MGIETILLVIGLAIVIAIGVGVGKAPRKASGTQAPDSHTRSTVRKRD